MFQRGGKNDDLSRPTTFEWQFFIQNHVLNTTDVLVYSISNVSNGRFIIIYGDCTRIVYLYSIRITVLSYCVQVQFCLIKCVTKHRANNLDNHFSTLMRVKSFESCMVQAQRFHSCLCNDYVSALCCFHRSVGGLLLPQ